MRNSSIRDSDQPRSGGATTILLVRHAEVHNPERVLYGRLPRFRLSDQGCRQADDLAAFLADKSISTIYHSPLLRARQTAARIARSHRQARLRQSSLLNEVRSAWQGTPFDDFEPGFNTFDFKREREDESIDDIRERMLRFVWLMRRRHEGECIVAVSHGDPITILRIALAGRPLTLDAIRGEEYADLCSITEITFCPEADQPRVRYLSVADAGADDGASAG